MIAAQTSPSVNIQNINWQPIRTTGQTKLGSEEFEVVWSISLGSAKLEEKEKDEEEEKDIFPSIPVSTRVLLFCQVL